MRHYDASARILIVDDDDMNRDILRTLFEDEYDILEARDGQEAIDLLTANDMRVSTILLDVFMPRVDGFGVLEFLQSHAVEPPIPVFFITAENASDVILRGFEMGVLDVILKPFVPVIIKRRISTALELYERRFAMEQTIRRQVEQLRDYAERLHENNLHMVDALSTIIEFRSFESGSHVQRVRSISDLLCREYMRLFPECGLTDDVRKNISIASVMHDVGKISIPDSVLAKPGRLTDSEMEIMRQHCAKGVELLEVVNRMTPLENAQYFFDICHYHHERWDGGGYPCGLKGDQIPLSAQIVSLADVYDALTNTRVYKPAYSHDEAVAMILDGKCGAFSPRMLVCFQNCTEHLRAISSGKV